MIPLNLYRPLQYIESTGTQYIDTGVTFSSNTRVVGKYKFNGTLASANMPFFGSNASDTPFYGVAMQYQGAKFNVGWNDQQYYTYDHSGVNVAYEIDFSKDGFIVNGVTKAASYSGTFTSTNTLWLLKNKSTLNNSCYLYYTKIYESGNIVRDLIPTQRISDSVIGMYDDVTGEFFTNAGTGSFVAGPVDYSGCALINVNGTITPSREAYINDNGTIKYCDEAYTNVNGTPTKIWQAGYSTEVSSANPVQTDIANARPIDYKIYGNTKQGELPDGYTQLEYITNGSGTRVDTGIACSDNMEFYVRTECNTLSSYYLLQRRGDGVTTIHGLTGSSSGATILLSFNGVNCQSSITRTGGHVYQIKGTVNNGNLTLYVKDETDDIEATNTSTYTVGTLPTNNICLCGNLGGDYLTSGQKIYDAYIKKDGSYVWKIKGAAYNGTTGVYNTVNGVFTTPGTGSFTAGPACPTPSAPLEIKGCGDMTSNLTNYVLNATATSDGTGGVVASGVSSGVTWKENTQYTFSLDCTYSNVTYSQGGNLIYVTIHYTDGTSSYPGITSVNYQQGRISFTSNANKTISSVPGLTKHARWTGGTMTLSNWKIEEGTTATAYEPYGYKVPIFQAQNCGCYTFTGDETSQILLDNWRPTDTTYAVGFKYSLFGDGVTYTPMDAVGPAYCDSSELPANTYSTVYGGSASPSYCYYTGNNNQYSLFVRLPKTIATSKNDVLTWLKGKTFYYQRTTDSTWTTPSKTNIYTQSPIYKVGTYTDTLLSAGLVNRKVGVKVLDGTENWNWDDKYKLFYFLPQPSMPTAPNVMYSTHFKNISYSQAQGGTDGFGFIYNVDLFIALHQYDNNLDDFKAFLASNPVTIVYPLATPTTEIITAPTISTVKGTNIFDTQCTVPDSQMTVDYIKKTK